MNQNSIGGTSVIRQPQITTETEALEKATHDLLEQLATLENRLTCVLTQEAPAPDNDKDTIVGGRVPLADIIFQSRRRIEVATDRVVRLSQRLEIA